MHIVNDPDVYYVQEVLPEALTPNWFRSSGFAEPLIVRSVDDGPQRMGMRLPQDGPLTVSKIVQGVGRERKVMEMKGCNRESQGSLSHATAFRVGSIE